jgi:hypothetical protein
VLVELPIGERAWSGGPRIIKRPLLMCCTDRNLPSNMRAQTTSGDSLPYLPTLPLSSNRAIEVASFLMRTSRV